MKEYSVGISVIMPVYNTSKYLDETITCFINQTFKDWELICVDDGSDDSSYDICEKYAASDSRIKAISQKNEGAGSARNRGYEDAKGEYVLFWDSDDTCAENFLEKMHGGIVENQADICICGYTSYGEGYREEFDRPSNISAKCFSLEELDDDGLVYCRLAPWNKLVSHELLDRYSIRFQNIMSSNDVYYTVTCLCKADRAIYLNDTGLIYHRVNRAGQISANRNPNDLLAALNEIKRMLTVDENKRKRRQIAEFALRAAISELRRCRNPQWIRTFYNDFLELLKEDRTIFSDLSETQKKYADMFTANSVEIEWWKPERICGTQLVKYRDTFQNILDQKKRAVVWGCGKRSEGFLQYCRENEFDIYAITDRSYEKASKFAGMYNNEYEVIRTDQVCNAADLIICANDEVYRYVKSINESIEKINLQMFCPVI